MAKILISSLGAGAKKEGSYEKALYKIDQKEYEASFIADVLVRHLKINKLFLVGTKQSIWDEAYSVFGGNDIDYQIILEEYKNNKNTSESILEKFNQTLRKRLGSEGSQAYLIDYGVDDDEIWGNFETFIRLSNEIHDGDELYLDITHSFRSLSMMSFVMTQFASSISNKKFTIKGVYYGMFEYRFETPEKITPIVDLSILLEIQEWIKAIDAIKKYSDFNPLVEILDKEGIESKVENAFTELNNAIDMANMAAIQKFIKNASRKIKAIGESGNKVVKLLVTEIVKLVEELDHERMSDFEFALAKWYFSNKNYAMSYMSLAEAIVTKNCELKGLDRNDLNKENQERVKSIQYPYDKNFQTKYPDSISNIRNNIAHQLKDREEFAGRDIVKLKVFLEEYASYFKL
jgi:CRISPR-associated Csx2 family protein